MEFLWWKYQTRFKIVHSSPINALVSFNCKHVTNTQPIRVTSLKAIMYDLVQLANNHGILYVIGVSVRTTSYNRNNNRHDRGKVRKDKKHIRKWRILGLGNRHSLSMPKKWTETNRQISGEKFVRDRRLTHLFRQGLKLKTIKLSWKKYEFRDFFL